MIKKFAIGSDIDEQRIFIIAELGTAHAGDALKARELAAAAIEAGADCVKFQHVYADEIIHPETGLVPLPCGTKKLYDCFKSVELPIEALASIKAATERLGALFLCTPFGLRSARELRSIGVACMKIASPELNYTQLLHEIASYNVPVILSSGVSLLRDIEEALSYFIPERTALLHCVTSYPAPEQDCNLRLIRNLSALFGVATGLSDHSEDPVFIPALAAAQGAVIIEKHFCMSKEDGGLDDPIALPPCDFAAMVRVLRQSPSVDDMRREYGAARVNAALGDGVKRLAASEKNNYSRTNRSLHALASIRAGDIVSEANTAVLRTEKILRPGLEPKYMPLIMGKKALRDIPAGEGIEWADIL